MTTQTTNGRAIKLIADVAVFTDGRVLLVRYADTNAYDHQAGWFLPDDLIGDGEHPGDAAVRILREQLGLDASPSLGFIESFTGRDGTWHLVFHHRLDLAAEPAAKLSSDVSVAEWSRLDALPPRAEVAHHGWALDVLEQLRPSGALV